MRGKGEGAVYRVPADKKQPLKYWTAVVELPPKEVDEDGKPIRRRRVIRSKDKAKVLDELSELREQLKENGDLPSATQTCAEWFTYWLEKLAAEQNRPKTVAGYRSVVNNHIIPAIGNVRLNQLTAAHIKRVHDRITSTPKDKDDPSKGFLSSTYALNAHRIMSASLTVAYREGRVRRNVAMMATKPRKAVSTLEVLDVDEAIALVEALSRQSTIAWEAVQAGTQEADADLSARWVTSLLTGARRGEVIGLERNRVMEDSIDLSWQLQRLKLTAEDGKPDVPADFEYRHLVGGLYLTRPKTFNSERVIHLVEPLKTVLHRHIANTPNNPWGLMWAPGGYPLDPDQDSRAWHEALQSAGIDKDVRLHDVRHTAVDLLYLVGIPEDLIQEIVGHSTVSVTRGYKSRGKVNKVRLTAAMETFSALFLPKQLDQ
jgi:integrase